MNHPLDQFRFCPKCGSSAFIIRNEKAKQCDSCDFVYYFNPSAAVACFLKNRKGEILVVRRAKEPAKGTLDLPGGFVDMNETAEEAMVREVKEETNLDVIEWQYLFSLPNIYPYSGFEVHTVDLFYLGIVDNFEQAKAADDAVETCVLSPEQLHPSDFGLLSIRKAVSTFIDNNCKTEGYRFT